MNLAPVNHGAIGKLLTTPSNVPKWYIPLPSSTVIAPVLVIMTEAVNPAIAANKMPKGMAMVFKILFFENIKPIVTKIAIIAINIDGSAKLPSFTKVPLSATMMPEFFKPTNKMKAPNAAEITHFKSFRERKAENGKRRR